MTYLHSFKVAGDYAVIFEHPASIDAAKIMAGKMLIEGVLNLD